MNCGMQGHDGGDAAWHREQRERNALEKAAYRKGQEDMRKRVLGAGNLPEFYDALIVSEVNDERS